MASSVIPLWRSGTPEASGREAELSVLLRGHEEARTAGKARFLFVRGPAGVGKSHLFGLLRQQLSARAVPVFEAESARDARRPFGLFAGVLEALLEELGHTGTSPEILAQLSRRVAPVLGRAELRQDPPEAERWELYDAASELFVLAGRATPVFLFPDVDAADRASLELFRYLAAVATAPESRAGGLFVVSFRDEGPMPAPLSEVLAKVSARTLSLGGLDLDGIRAFLGRAGVAERLFEATGGMPAVLEELFHPTGARPLELFQRRVAKLSDDARELLALLAVAPSALDASTLGEALTLAGVQLSSVPTELDALVREHLLTVKVVSGAPMYRFAREADGKAFGQELLPSARVRAQRAVGEALLARGDALGAAELLLEVDAKGRGAAAARLAAETLVARGAHEEAGALYARLLDVLSPHERAPIHRRLAELAWTQGQAREVVRHLSRARPERPRPFEAELYHRASRALLRLGRFSAADRLLARVLSSDSGEVKAGAAVTRAELLLARGRPEQALQIGDEMLSQLVDVPETEIALRNALGRARLIRGELALARELFEQNYARAQAARLPQLASQALINQGVVAHREGNFEAAIRFYESGLPAGNRPGEARALAGLAAVYTETGDFERALDHHRRALQSFSRLGVKNDVAHAASNLARLLLFLGELDRAVELAEYALGLGRELAEPYLQASALLTLGTALLEQREALEAQRTLEEARELFERVGNAGYGALAAALKARSHLREGERAQAEAELSRRVVERGAAELSAATVEVELTRGELALLLGDLHGAGRAVGRARDALLQKPDLEGPYRVYFLGARLRAAAGDLAGAQAELSRSARLLDELTHRVPAARRMVFLSIGRRSEVLAAAEPELRLPRTPAGSVPRLEQEATNGFVGRSQAMLKVAQQLPPVARSNATVLIRGESGTGKELLAQAIHDLSPRRSMPIIKVNCAAMVEDLLLSELFGHEKGAFTGAVRERKGRFELADGGTLFLDEIGDISPKCQVALLRVLQERELQRVGGTKTLKVDVRVICATNRDLETLIAEGRFRQDLYYRLRGVMLELPALRTRFEDLGLLAQHFLERVAKERGERPKQLSQDALALLERHSWPGNVRELENVLASGSIFAEGELVTPESFLHVPELAALMGVSLGPAADAAVPPSLASVERSAPFFSRPLVEAPSAAVFESRSGSETDDDLDVEQDDDERSEGRALAPLARHGAELDFYGLARQSGLSLKDLRHQVEMQCISQALREAKGNISEAARLLRMKRSRLSQIVNAEPELKGLCHGE